MDEKIEYTVAASNNFHFFPYCCVQSNKKCRVESNKKCRVSTMIDVARLYGKFVIGWTHILYKVIPTPTTHTSS